MHYVHGSEFWSEDVRSTWKHTHACINITRAYCPYTNKAMRIIFVENTR